MKVGSNQVGCACRIVKYLRKGEVGEPREGVEGNRGWKLIRDSICQRDAWILRFNSSKNCLSVASAMEVLFDGV